jgi:hypothetical protein
MGAMSRTVASVMTSGDTPVDSGLEYGNLYR